MGQNKAVKSTKFSDNDCSTFTRSSHEKIFAIERVRYSWIILFKPTITNLKSSLKSSKDPKDEKKTK